MSSITKIVEAKNKKRASIYVDDCFVCYLDLFTIFKHKLKVGSELNSDTLQEIQLESEQGTAFDMAVKYISRAQKSKNEIKLYLQKKGFLPAVIENVIQKIEDYRYVNDEILAKNVVNLQSSKYGKQKLKILLKNRGISDGEIENALESVENEYENALLVAKKYIKNKEITQENINKMGKFLLSRGFSWDDVSHVMYEIKRNENNENWH